MSDSPFAKYAATAVVPDTIDVFGILGYTPSERQQVFHEASREKIDAILYGGAAGGGKELDIHSPIPTPDGFIPMGDIHPGQKVFGRDGKVYEVVYESEIHHHEAYLLTFDDGSTATVNDEHLWLTYDAKELAALTRRDPNWKNDRRAKRRSRAKGNKSNTFVKSISAANSKRSVEHESKPVMGTVRTTREIVDTLTTGGGRANHAVPVCAPVEIPEKDLPIPPYLLGAWLGDGSSASGRIYGIDFGVFENAVSSEFPIASIKHQASKVENGNDVAIVRFEGLTTALRENNLLHHKHIPQDYLWASIEQRLALVQGLMDTDGNINTNGTAEFVNTNQNIVEGLAQLLRSLGHKVAVREGRAKLNGKDCGPVWKIKFKPKMMVCRLTRKAERIDLSKNRRTVDFRYIKSAKRLPSKVHMKCIEVTSPDHLYLATENFIPTHNTAAFIMEALWLAANFPGIRIGCFRRSYPELEESFLQELARRQFARPLSVAFGGSPPVWNATNKVLKFPNGSSINFTYAETVQDASRILGGEYQAFFIDEAGQMLPTVIAHIEERLRSGNKLIPVIGLRLASNPGGVGHLSLKKRFINPTRNGKVVAESVDDKGNPTGQTVAFIPAKATDNPHLNKGYFKVLDSIPDPQRRAAMRDGNWDAMVGQFFEQWDRSRHVVNQFPIPKEWQRYCGIDYGVRAPFAAIWGAVDNDQRIWMYREIYASGVYAEQQAQAIVEAEQAAGEFEVIRVADPSMWGDRGTPLSVSDIYGMNGCGIMQANNNRMNGWARVHAYLNDGPACDIHKAMGWETCPMLHVFEETCPMFIETIPTLPRSQVKPDDAETKNVEDHIADALRYMCMEVGTFATPIFYDSTPSMPNTGAPIPAEKEQPQYEDEPIPLVSGIFAGDLGIDSYLAEN